MKLPQHKDSLEPKIFHWKPFSMLWGYRTRRLIKSSIKLVYQWRSIEYSVLLATKRTWVQFPAAASSFKQKYDKSKQIMVDSIIVIIMSLACKLSCESPPPPLTLLSINQNVNLKGHDRLQSRGAFNKVGVGVDTGHLSGLHSARTNHLGSSDMSIKEVSLNA